MVTTGIKITVLHFRDARGLVAKTENKVSLETW